jgi:acetyltransferase
VGGFGAKASEPPNPEGSDGEIERRARLSTEERSLSNSTDYPIQWTRVATTRDNVSYRIRPIRAEDAARERAFIMGLSAESRYERMMYTMGEPSADLVNRFVHVDYHHNMAFVAVVGQDDDERIIGVARYAANGDEGYEFAVVTADEWQARGVGATLSQLLLDYARIEGIRTLHARILVSNHRMIEFARWLGMSIHFSPEDPMILRASLDL